MDSLDTGYEICVLKGEDRGKTFPLRAHELNLGRKSGEERQPGWVHFAEPTVSRHHASLVWDENRRHYTIHHKSGTNPTIVNGKRVQHCALAHDDVVQVGLCVFKVIYVGPDPVSAGAGRRTAPASSPVPEPHQPPEPEDDGSVQSGLKLVATEGPDRGAVWMLTKTVMFIGRREGPGDRRGQNGILLNDSGLPKEQVLLAWNERERTYGIFQMEGTMDPTEIHRLVDGRHQVVSLEGGMQALLMPDDLLRLGDTTLCVAYEDQEVQVDEEPPQPEKRDDPGHQDAPEELTPPSGHRAGGPPSRAAAKTRHPEPGPARPAPAPSPSPRPPADRKPSRTPDPDETVPNLLATQRLNAEVAGSEYLKARATEVQKAANALRSIQGRNLNASFGGDEDEQDVADMDATRSGPDAGNAEEPSSAPNRPDASAPQALRRPTGGEPQRISQLLRGANGSKGGPERIPAPPLPAPPGDPPAWPPMPPIGPASLTELSRQLGNLTYPPLETGFSRGGVPMGPSLPVPAPGATPLARVGPPPLDPLSPVPPLEPPPAAPAPPRPPAAAPHPPGPRASTPPSRRPPAQPRPPAPQTRMPAPGAALAPPAKSPAAAPPPPVPGATRLAGPSAATPPPIASRSVQGQPPVASPAESPGLPHEYRPPELYATEEDAADLEPDFGSGTFSWKYRADYIIGFLEGRNRGQKVELLTRELQDGRQIPMGCRGERFNEVEIEDPGVGNRHAMITYNGGRFSLLNEGRDGTIYVNQLPIRHGEAMLLKTGDRIHLGESVLIFLERAVVQVLNKYEFVVLTGIPDDRLKSFDFLKEVVVVGRLKSCDMVLADPEVSRKHLAITLRGGRFYLTHLSSSNPTFINGVSLPRGRDRILNEGDKVQLSDHTTLLFRLRPASPPKPGTRARE